MYSNGYQATFKYLQFKSIDQNESGHSITRAYKSKRVDVSMAQLEVSRKSQMSVLGNQGTNLTNAKVLE